MANHTSQLLTINCEKEIFNKIKETVKGKTDFDQNSFFPMPIELTNTNSPARIVTDEDYEKFQNGEEVKTIAEMDLFKQNIKVKKSKNENYPELMDKPISLSMNIRFLMKYGVNNWYDWAKVNWGTKWGIYNVGEWNDVSQSIGFQVAWSSATLIIQKLSSLFPSVEFVLDAADEGGGFLQTEIIKNGEVETLNEFEWDSDEGIELRSKLGVYHPEDDEEEIQVEV